MGAGVHDSLLALTLHLALDNAPQPDHTQIVVTIIGAVGVVLAALVAGLLGARSPRESRAERRTAQTAAAYLAELIQGRKDAEHDCAIAENDLRDAKARLEVYERFLWLRRYDPKKILTGEEPPSDARA